MMTNQQLTERTNDDMTDRFGKANGALSLANGYARIPTIVNFNGDFTFTAWYYPRAYIYYGFLMTCQPFNNWDRTDSITLVNSIGVSGYPFIYIASNSRETSCII